MRSRRWAHLGQAAAILTALAFLATVAGAANRGGDAELLGVAAVSSGLESDLTGTVSQAVTEVSLPAAASAVAAEHAAAGLEMANAAISSAAQGATQAAINASENASSNGRASEHVAFISPATQAAPAGTVGTRPGWGCGDKNHDHTGPPGRPGATSPCK